MNHCFGSFNEPIEHYIFWLRIIKKSPLYFIHNQEYLCFFCTWYNYNKYYSNSVSKISSVVYNITCGIYLCNNFSSASIFKRVGLKTQSKTLEFEQYLEQGIVTYRAHEVHAQCASVTSGGLMTSRGPTPLPLRTSAVICVLSV